MLFADDRCANIFEALVGTLRAAKKRKVKKNKKETSPICSLYSYKYPENVVPFARGCSLSPKLASLRALLHSTHAVCREQNIDISLECLSSLFPLFPFTQMIHFEGEMLLQGAHDHVDVVLLNED